MSIGKIKRQGIATVLSWSGSGTGMIVKVDRIYRGGEGGHISRQFRKGRENRKHALCTYLYKMAHHLLAVGSASMARV